MKFINRIVLFVSILILAIATLLPFFLVTPQPLQAQTPNPTPLTYFPIFGFHTDPPASTSYYLPTVDGTFLYELGCEHGRIDLALSGVQDTVTVLDFSYPVYTASLGYGVALFEDNPFDGPMTPPVSIHAIQQGVKQFALGYYRCSGSDVASNLVIGVGTNNKSTSIESETRARAHGQAWGQMVSELNQWALNQKIFHQVQRWSSRSAQNNWRKKSGRLLWPSDQDR